MRIAFQHAAVHERAGIAFVGVADDEFASAPALATMAHLSPSDSRRRRGRAGRSRVITSIDLRRGHLAEGVAEP